MENKNKFDYLMEIMQKNDEDFENSGLSSVEIATARIEQGNLYKLLIQHDIFENVNADPKVLDKVRAEIIAFATFRLEILLGIKNYEKRNVDRLDLTEEEILILKEFLSKIKNKVSLSGEDIKQSTRLKPIQADVRETKINKIVDSDKKINTASSKQDEQSVTENKKDQFSIRDDILKRKNEILKQAEERGGFDKESRKEYEELTKMQVDSNIQRPYHKLYQPIPSVNEENAISASRSDLLVKNLDKILKA